MSKNKKYVYNSWKEYIFKQKRLFLLVLLIIISLLTIPLIMWIRFKPSPMSNTVDIFVNYADNDVGIDIVPEGLKYSWYLYGTIIENGFVDSTGMLTFDIFDSDGVYILELGKEQYTGQDYAPAISNYTFIHGTTSEEIEIGAKFLEGAMFWEGAIPIDTQSIDLWMLNEITSLYDIFVGTYITNSEGFIQASVIKGGYQWQINGMPPLPPTSQYIQWHDLGKTQDFIFALKVREDFYNRIYYRSSFRGGS